jgi:biotin operon repressor
LSFDVGPPEPPVERVPNGALPVVITTIDDLDSLHPFFPLLTALSRYHIVSDIPVNQPTCRGGLAWGFREEPLQPIERPESLTESTVKRIRQAIVSGDLGLGLPLSERQLADMLGVSKTPVREALAQLRREGLVRIVPQRGASVFTLSQQEVIDICGLRQGLTHFALPSNGRAGPSRPRSPGSSTT